MVPDFLDVAVTRTEVGSFAGVPLVLLQDSALHPAYAIVKRVMDVGISVVTLVLGLPLWLAIALLIKLTSKGPVFSQERMGVYGKPFRMYKFRSMVSDADEQLRNIIDLDSLAEPVYKIPRDPASDFDRQISATIGPRRDSSAHQCPAGRYERRGTQTRVGGTGGEVRTMGTAQAQGQTWHHRLSAGYEQGRPITCQTDRIGPLLSQTSGVLPGCVHHVKKTMLVVSRGWD